MRFVLIHGAWHGAWCWEPVVAELEAAGHSVRAPDLPGSGEDRTPLADVTLDAYAERICEVLGTEEEPAVLVGHSMGGIAVTQAAERCPERVASLVYVAAFLPGDGQSLVDLAGLPEGAGDKVQSNMVVAGEPPSVTLPAAAAREAFYGACDEEQTAWALEHLRPQALAPFVTPVALGGASADLARAYVLCTEDQAIPAPLQRRMSGERATGAVAELETDHSPFLSRTSELVALLERLPSVRP
jgi:pimeloyl-ACP methyl ester carboxylesterase